MFNSLVGDDWPNSQIMKFVQWRYGALTPSLFFHEIYFWVQNWATGQGRFYPLSYLQQQIYFYIFGESKLLNLAYGLTFIIALTIWAKIFAKLTGSQNSKILISLISIPVMKFRFDFEPHLGFSQISLWPLIWVGGSILCFIKFMELKKIRHGIISSILLFAGFCHYEIAITLLPLFIVIYILNNSTRSDSRFGSITKFLFTFRFHIGVTALYLYIVFGYLRPRSNPTGNYVSGFELFSSVRTFIFQNISVIPFTGTKINSLFALPQRSLFIFMTLITMVLIYIILSIRIPVTKYSENSKKGINNQFLSSQKKMTYLFYFYLILAPGLVVAIQPTQWEIIKFGRPYLGILFSEFGFIGLISTFLEFRIKKLISLKKKSSKYVMSPKEILSFGTVIYLIVSVATLTNNYRFIESTKNRENLSSTWLASNSSPALFAKVKNGDAFISTTTNDAYEINVADFYLRTGKRLAQFFLPQYLWPNYFECPNNDCPLMNIEKKVLEVLPNSTRPKSTIFYVSGKRDFVEDYPSSLLKSEKLQFSTFWYYNIYQLTPATGVVYLTNFVKDSSYAKIDLKNLKIALVYAEKNEFNFKPNVNGVCIRSNLLSTNIVATKYGPRVVKVWDVNTKNGPEDLSVIDPRSLQVSSCI